MIMHVVIHDEMKASLSSSLLLSQPCLTQPADRSPEVDAGVAAEGDIRARADLPVQLFLRSTIGCGGWVYVATIGGSGSSAVVRERRVL